MLGKTPRSTFLQPAGPGLEKIRPLLLIILWVLLFSPALEASPADEEETLTLGERVNLAIKKGVEHLRTKQNEDGSFVSAHTDRYPDGVASLCTLALLKSGMKPDDPAVRKTLGFLRYQSHTRTYSTGVRIMALDTLRDPERTPAIKAAADWLVENFRNDVGHWGYPEAAPDLSNTQYAVLGLWTAEKHGHKAPQELWNDLAERTMQHQSDDGGYGYHANSESTGSMTLAGISVLAICLDRVSKKTRMIREIENSLESAWGYMDRRFHPAGNAKGSHIFTRARYYYYLYGLERACALGDRRKVGGRDWYRECAAELVKLQNDEGGWGDAKDTCFALLFLRLSTYTSMRKKLDTDTTGGPGGGRKEIKPRVNIPFVRRWLLLGPFDDPDRSALFTKSFINEQKADPRKGKIASGQRWTEHWCRTRCVDLDSFFSKRERAVAYAFTHLEAEEDLDALLWIGSDDCAKVWLDGREIFEYPFFNREGPDTHSVPITLTRGSHRLLVKVAEDVGRWDFYLRFSRPDGSPLERLFACTEKEGPSLRDRFEAAAPFLEPREIFELLPLDRKPRLRFDSERDLERLFFIQNHENTPYLWSRKPARGEGQRPHPGAEGVLCLHPLDRDHPAKIFRKVRIASGRARAVARLSACHPEVRKSADWVARIGVFDGHMVWFDKTVIAAGESASPKGWKEITVDLSPYEGREVLLILECAAGGPGGDWNQEFAFIDEFSVKG